MFKCGGGEQEEVLRSERHRARKRRIEGLFPYFLFFF